MTKNISNKLKTLLALTTVTITTTFSILPVSALTRYNYVNLRTGANLYLYINGVRCKLPLNPSHPIKIEFKPSNDNINNNLLNLLNLLNTNNKYNKPSNIPNINNDYNKPSNVPNINNDYNKPSNVPNINNDYNKPSNVPNINNDYNKPSNVPNINNDYNKPSNVPNINNDYNKPSNVPNINNNYNKPSNVPNINNNYNKPSNVPNTNNDYNKPSNVPNIDNNNINTGNFSSYQKQVLDLVNVERTKRGLNKLTLDNNLSSIATVKCQDMIDKNYFDHNSPTYGSPFNMMNKFGVNYRSAGENIAEGQRSPQEVMNAWMNSEGHRKNILSPNFTTLGVGVAKTSSGILYWTQMFIG